MSKKTRKEKIIAELRRELKKGNTSVPSKPLHKNKSINRQKDINSSSKHIAIDLKKTVILSVLAIIIELSLYYYLR